MCPPRAWYSTAVQGLHWGDVYADAALHKPVLTLSNPVCAFSDVLPPPNGAQSSPPPLNGSAVCGANRGFVGVVAVDLFVDYIDDGSGIRSGTGYASMFVAVVNSSGTLVSTLCLCVCVCVPRWL